MGRRGRPGSPRSGADSADPCRTPDVLTPAPGTQLLQREAPRASRGCPPREGCSGEPRSPERMAGAHRTNPAPYESEWRCWGAQVRMRRLERMRRRCLLPG